MTDIQAETDPRGSNRLQDQKPLEDGARVQREQQGELVRVESL